MHYTVTTQSEINQMRYFASKLDLPGYQEITDSIVSPQGDSPDNDNAAKEMICGSKVPIYCHHTM